MDAFTIGQQVAKSINSGGSHTLLDRLKTLVEKEEKEFGKPLKIDNVGSIEGTGIGDGIHTIKTATESTGNYTFLLEKKGTTNIRLVRLRRYPNKSKLYQLSLEYEHSVMLPIKIIKSKILFLQEMRALLMK